MSVYISDQVSWGMAHTLPLHGHHGNHSTVQDSDSWISGSIVKDAPSHDAYLFMTFWGSIMLGMFSVSSLVFTISLFNFRYALNAKQETPTVPYWIPGLFHGLSMAQPGKYLASLIKLGSEKPLLIRAGWLRFYFLTDPEHIKAAFRNPKKTSNRFTTLFALKNLVCLPKEAVKFYEADDSGMGVIPRKESTTLPERRINFLIKHNLNKFFAPKHMQPLSERFHSNLTRHLDGKNIGSDWVEHHDLHEFVAKLTTASLIEALAGSKIFELCPGLIDDLFMLQSYTPKFLHMVPRWLIPKGYQLRQKLLNGIKAWHKHAHEHSDCTKIAPEDPDWEPYFGSKIIRARQQYTINLKEMGPDARASEDLGLLGIATQNVVTSTFWMIMETLKDPNLLAQLKNEINSCIGDDSVTIDASQLATQPLLQSTYAEVLRMYIAGVVSRSVEYSDINIGGHNIPKDSYLVVYSRATAMNHERWVRAGRTLNKSLDEFDAERFLVDHDWVRPGLQAKRETEPSSPSGPENRRRFSMDGLLGLWTPYGGGDHICPGRHLAKQIMALTLSVFITQFDFELDLPDNTQIGPDMKFAPFGAIPPNAKVPFRLRRKAQI